MEKNPKSKPNYNEPNKKPETAKKGIELQKGN